VGIDLQKASVMKRVAAWLLDIMLLCVATVGFACLLSWIFGYSGYNDALEAGYDRYETKYGVVFNIGQEEYESMTADEKALYDKAYDELIHDEEVLYNYNMVVNLSLLMTTFGILLSVLLLEFVVPLILKNGQTVGKKCFSMGLVRNDGVKINTMQLFARTFLGKFTIETMIPVYIVMMIFWGLLDVTGTLVLIVLAVVQFICVTVTRTNSAIHDLIAGTVAVDLVSQKIFDSTEELIEYTKRIHAERAAREDY